MATNYIEPGKEMQMPTVTGAKSNDAFVVGDFLPCVLLTDAGAASPYNAVVATEGVFKLSVKGHNGSVDIVANVGDALHWTDKDTALDKDSSKAFFGIALEAVGSGETKAIAVLLTPKAALPGSVGNSDIEDGSVSSVKLAADTIQYATVEVSSEEILALNAAPKTLVAAQGANKAIELISMAMFLDYNSAPYADNGILGVYETDASGTLVSDTVALADFLAKTEDTIKFVPPVATDFSMSTNVPLVLTMATGASITGDSPVTVKVAYRVHDFS
jgi:predicted RecA/RadA family phage recombinase